MNQLCKVCGEPAAGYHFGAFTCEGCKSFFGRTYNNPSTIGECKNSNQCVINKKNRTSCKSCRLKKCLAVGMSKTGSRYGRRSNWFKLHCALDSQNNQSSLTGNSNGPIQISESFNENKDLVNQIKAETNSRDLINLKSPTINGSVNAKNSNNKNSSSNSLNGSTINHTLHNITNHSNVFTSNGSARQCINTSNNNNNNNNSNNNSNNHSSPGLASSNGQSPLETSEGLANLNLPEPFSMIQTVAKALGISPFDPINSFMLQRNGEPKVDLKLLNAAAAVQASSSKSNHYSQFIHPLNISSSSSSSPPLATSGQQAHSRVNLTTSTIGSTMTTSLSNSPSPNVTPNGRVDTPNGNLNFPFHHYPSTTGSPSLHHHQHHNQHNHPGHHHGLPMSPLGSTLDPSSRLLFAAQLFGKGLNVLPKEFNNINNYFLNPSYTRFLPIGSINQIAKLTSASPNNLTLKSTPPLPSELLYEQERPIDLSRKSTHNSNNNNNNNNKNMKNSSKLNKCIKQLAGSEDEDDEDDEPEEDEDAELCLHDDNNNATRDEGSKSMIGDHDSGFSPSSNEDNIVATTPLDLTAKKSPTPSPTVTGPISLPN